MPEAVELTVDGAWFIADRVGAGSYPWVLAITPPVLDTAESAAFAPTQIAELTQLGVMADGIVNTAVQQWVRIVCCAERWLELRYVDSARPEHDLLRGIVARRDEQTVVALRNGNLLTLTPLDIGDSCSLASVVAVGLSGCAAAHFEEFALPVRVGVRADRQLREAAELSDVMDYLGIPKSARAVVRAVFDGPRSYVEVVAGQRYEATQQTTEVGIAVVDTTAGRVVVSPTREFHGEWVSTFAAGTSFSVAVALERLTDTLQDGRWFQAAPLTRDFTI